MMRWITVLIATLWSLTAAAEEPVVEVEFETAEAIPGQSLTLRVTVLVPTWMPKPVVFPSFEAPNLRIHLPEKATGPVSKKIDGETWSGVSRRVQVTPMVPGQFQIPAQELIVTWVAPDQAEPLVTTVALDPIQVTGSVPAGAEDLDPFVAAEALELTSDIGDIAMPMKAGDSLSITVAAKVEGTSPMFLPALIPPVQIEGIAAYPAEPVVEESENRGKLSGSRTESLSLVAESGGSGEMPEITMRWFNLKTKKVETATVEGFDVSVDAPSAALQNVSSRAIIAVVLAGLLALFVLWLIVRWGVPRVRRLLSTRRDRIAASEPYAFDHLQRAVAAKDFAAMMQALDLWAGRVPVDPRDIDPFQSALSDLGAARYGPNKTQEDTAWRAVKAALIPTREKALHTLRTAASLPPLNPQGLSA